MSNSRKILVIDGDANRRFLLVRTIMRVFPQASIIEVQDAQAVRSVLAAHEFDAAVVHSGVSTDPGVLVRTLREIAPKMPILAMSRREQAADLLSVGATQCLGHDEWLLVGQALTDLLAAPPAPGLGSVPGSPDPLASAPLSPAPA